MGRGRGASLRQRAGLASAVWAVAFSLLAVVAATPRGPTAALSVDDVTPVVGQIVHFDASASVGHDEGNGRIVSYEFDFGDGDGTREQSSPMASHAYSLVGPKRATVTVQDARENEGSASVRIDVQAGSRPPEALRISRRNRRTRSRRNPLRARSRSCRSRSRTSGTPPPRPPRSTSRIGVRTGRSSRSGRRLFRHRSRRKLPWSSTRPRSLRWASGTTRCKSSSAT